MKSCYISACAKEESGSFTRQGTEPSCLATFCVNIQLTAIVSASVYVPSISYYDNMIISLAWPDLFRRRTQDYITCNINRHKFTTYWDTLKHTVYTKPISSFQGCISVLKSIIRAIRVPTEFAIVKVCGCKFMDLYYFIVIVTHRQATCRVNLSMVVCTFTSFSQCYWQ